LALKHIGTISAGEIKNLSGGLFAMDVPVTVNCRLFEYDQIIIAGAVFPHEVVGFSDRDPATIDPEDLANREDEGVLLVPKAGEMLYHLGKRPDRAREM
jgi:hypothetical protein